MTLPVDPYLKPLGRPGQFRDDFISPISKFSNGGDIHEHFGVDDKGNINWGITTINIPGYKPLHLDWGKGK